MSYQAIIFDFGNVIATFSDTYFTDGLARHCEKSSEQLYQIIYENNDLKTDYEMGSITSDEFFHRIIELTGALIEKDEFIRIYTSIFTPVPETISLIHKLKQNYKLGLLSNTSEWDFEFGIKAIQVFPLFDAVTASFKLKKFKPDKELYLDNADKLSVSPQECIYIDDIKEYADAASNLGMTGIHYTGPDELLSRLRDLGIRV